MKVDLAATAITFRTATASVAEAEELKSLDAEKTQEAEKKKDHLEVALENLKVLSTIAPEEAEARTKQNAMLAMLKKYKFEESMLIALPVALAKSPDTRGQFDLMAVSQLEGEIGKMIVEQESILLSAKPGAEKCEFAVKEAREHLDELRLQQRVAAQSFDAASQYEATCEESSIAAHKAVQKLTQAMKHHKETVLNAEVEVELFQQGPLETFKGLCERATPAPEVEIAPELEIEVTHVEEEQPMEIQETDIAAVAVC